MQARYLEAYPSLCVAEALRNWQRGRPVCLWRNEDGFVRVRGAVDWLSPTRLSVRVGLDVQSCRTENQHVGQFDVTYVAAGRSVRPLIECPGCKCARAKLFLAGTQFKCRHCLGLPNRSATLSYDQGLREKLHAIDRFIGQGRPPGMRNALYHQLQAERSEIVRLLSPRAGAVPRGKMVRFTSEWVDSDYLEHAAANAG